MISQQFLDYARQQFSAGVTKEQIKSTLLAEGWNEADLDQGFKALETMPQGVESEVVSTQSPLGASPNTVSTPPVARVIETPTPSFVMPKPRSVSLFEKFMYMGIALGVLVQLIILLVQYYSLSDGSWGNVYVVALLMAAAMPLISSIIRAYIVYFSTSRKSNIARIILLILFFGHGLNLVGIVGVFFYNPIIGLASLVPVILEVVAFCYLFSPSSNAWFQPVQPTSDSLQNVESKTWTKVIPRMNTGFLIVSLLLVFGLDLFILIQSPDLAPFWFAMLAVFVLFMVFYYLENFVYKKKFSTSQSGIDVWISALSGIRNSAFILCYIPLIQILGWMVVGVAGIPYLIAYYILIRKRYQSIQVS